MNQQELAKAVSDGLYDYHVRQGQASAVCLGLFILAYALLHVLTRKRKKR